ncbi:rRNA maturation RNase YbeY [Roseovarius sp. SCSIO 43702]|uniref:rRNA maturation RNase YbeY n=1 Tax=Roseovarius sp. SCSIO 43702 TaxID=2823043 RepID=UPI001C72FE38|nr:rRNA maturation RNase YbeY [Roseovarius sp. SCSIO 43702]QYX55917.1 rRNA maturation RNase YbeY [Roseovarius sp. SCSIO 43702]
MPTETLIEDVRWHEAGLAALAERAAAATLAHLGLDPGEWHVSVLGCDDARIAVLNADFRDKPRPTNVLSWPSEERAAATPGKAPDPPDPQGDTELGDIAIAFDTCAREADGAGRPLADHVTHLLVHATLHLLGYDHEDARDAALMERLEVAILGEMGITDPYI